jgi:hypothetical protein
MLPEKADPIKGIGRSHDERSGDEPGEMAGMTDATPAEELRTAAKAMRERAKPCDQGSWIAVPSSALATARVDGADWTVCRAHDNEAVHIASWHPGVALAVADWLDRFGDELYCYGPAEFDHALAITRAFLGTSPESVAEEGQ